jgi:hypothetical protein
VLQTKPTPKQIKSNRTEPFDRSVQLAHDEQNKVRAAYNHAQYLPERRRMMQHWADYLDDLADGGKVVVGQFGRAD